MSLEYSQQLFDEFPWVRDAQSLYSGVDAIEGIHVTYQLMDNMMWASAWDELQRLCRLLEGISFDEVGLGVQLAILTSLRACRERLNGCYEILYLHLEAQLIIANAYEKEIVLEGLK